MNSHLTFLPNSPPETGAQAPLAIEFIVVSLAATNRFGGAPKEWRQGDRWELVAEPTNKNDPNAIKVMREGRQIGYVARVDAEKFKLRANDGWRLSGWCFFDGKNGGKWNEGTLRARLENPVMGWEGFNPFRPLSENRALMEASAIAAITASSLGDEEPRATAAKPRL